MASYLLPENALQIVRGTSRSFRLKVVNPVDGMPIDLTSGRIVFTVKKRIEDDIPLIQKTSSTSSEIDLFSPLTGESTIYLLPTDTRNLDIGSYVYDVWALFTGDQRHIVIPPSVFEVQRSVTTLL